MKLLYFILLGRVRHIHPSFLHGAGAKCLAQGHNCYGGWSRSLGWVWILQSSASHSDAYSIIYQALKTSIVGFDLFHGICC